MASQTKQSQVENLIDVIQKSNNFALIKFQKTLHTTLESLRNDLKTNNSQIRVIKNSLFQKAFNKLVSKNKKLANLKDSVKSLRDNTALLLLGDEWNKGLTAFYKFAKKEQTLSFKFGFLDEAVYQSADLTKMAELPPKEELLAKVIGSMKTPISHLHYTMKYNMQKFVYILSEQSKKTS